MVEPLRRKRRDGSPYQRRPEVEAELEGLENLGLPDVLAHAREGERKREMSVSSEALVHILRREVRTATTRSQTLGPIDGLASILMQRAKTIVQRHLGGFDESARDEISGKVLDRIVDAISDDSDLADYAEVNFNDWLSHKRVDECRKLKRELARTVPLGNVITHVSGDEPQIMPGVIEGRASTEPTPEAACAISEARDKANLPPQIAAGEFSPEDRYRIAAMVKWAQLSPDVLEAFLLHYYWGMQIESNDPGKHTLVKQFGKSEKTIRLWLGRAEKAFAKLRGEKHGPETDERSEPGIGAARLSR